MHSHEYHSLAEWQHEHHFGLHKRRPAEARTFLVVAITAAAMAIEIAGGIAFGSMALLADGLHMGSHALALSISAFAYLWMRLHAGDERYALGTGKIAALSGFTGALLLLVPAASMAWESVARLIDPRPIEFQWALWMAAFGLAVNLVCAWILWGADGHDRAHSHHGHDNHADGHDDDHDYGQDHGRRRMGREDVNLRSAFLHVITDAATSILAIVALLAGALWGQGWLDPAMGIVGAGVIAVWSWGLLRDSSHTLLDRAAHTALEKVRKSIESVDDNRLADIHVWSIAPGIYAAALSVVTHDPKPPQAYKALIPASLGVEHVTVEVHRCEVE